MITLLHYVWVWTFHLISPTLLCLFYTFLTPPHLDSDLQIWILPSLGSLVFWGPLTFLYIVVLFMKMFFSSISMFISSSYLSAAFHSNVSCLSAGLPHPSIVCIGLVLLTMLSASLPGIAAALVTSIAACVTTCVMFCSVVICSCTFLWDYLLWVCLFSDVLSALCEPSCHSFSHHVMLPAFKEDTITGSFWLCLFHMLYMIIISYYMYIYKSVIMCNFYVQIALVWICVLVCLWLLYVQSVIGWTYITYALHTHEYYLNTETLASVFVSYSITTTQISNFFNFMCIVLVIL